ncbi:unnamed protein product [Anisakis simplex]|uniref:Ion_trans_2 domain-containing protein n=1 Tax=Anisakis simplex TaxID=6269 RepID=A0A0M3K8P5_ANISI|nr:unnamed protein product [Anisakis simplex]
MDNVDPLHQFWVNLYLLNSIKSRHETRSFKRNRRRSYRRRSKSANTNSSSTGSEANTEPKKRLPLSVNASILLIFCMLGGLVYLGAGGQKTFIEAFFVTFNLVANLTMAEMPNDLNHVLTLFYILIFVTFGLAVLSMCGELAASELKSLFLKIHYFGRKIDWRRNRRDHFKWIQVEVREMLKIIEAIRKRHPNIGKISSADILEYMHEMNDGIQSATMCTKHERRDTIAFMPQTIEALKFADEMDMDENHRTMSRVEYEIHHEPIGLIDI